MRHLISAVLISISSPIVGCSHGGNAADARGGLGGIGSQDTYASAGVPAGTVKINAGAGRNGGSAMSGGTAATTDNATGSGGLATAPTGYVSGTERTGGAGGFTANGGAIGIGGAGKGGAGKGGSGGAVGTVASGGGRGGTVAAGAGRGGTVGTSAGGAGRGGTSAGGAGRGGAGGTVIADAGRGGTSGPGKGGAAASGTAGNSKGGGTGGPKILWSDDFHITTPPWGLDDALTEYPVGTSVTPSDANGANLSVVADPLGGAGRALRQFGKFDTGGARSQGGLYGDFNTIFGNQAKKPEGIWIAQEWYFPEAITAAGDDYCWISVWDWHSIDSDRGNRWPTSPGVNLAQDGSMRVLFGWAVANPTSAYSSIAMPVGRWFDIEMHYVWVETPTATISLWIDGELALEQSGVTTKAASHQVVETYLKFYGSTQGRGPWVPTPSLKYTRNVRIAGERIWR